MQSVAQRLLICGMHVHIGIEDNDLRVSARYPTLETRVADMCTRLDDCASLMALTQSVLHYLNRLRCDRKGWPVFTRFLVDQNRWRAMRYGYDEGLGAKRALTQVVDWLIEETVRDL